MSAISFLDRVKETTTTTGTGTLTLAGAATGYQAFSVLGNGARCRFCTTDNTNWEIAEGVWSTGGTLTRATIIASSNSGSAVSWSAGSKDVFLVADASFINAVPNVTASTSAPTNPRVNDFWFKTDEGSLKFYYNDGDSTQWIDIMPGVPAGSGALQGIAQLTASSSASLDFTSAISAAYDEYVIKFINILPATNGVNFLMRMGGGSFDTGTNYEYVGWYNGNADVLTGAQGATQSAIHIADSMRNDSNSLTLNGEWRLYNPASSTAFKQAGGTVFASAVGAARLYRWDLSGAWESTTAADRFQFFFSSGNIASGTIRVYGVSKSF